MADEKRSESKSWLTPKDFFLWGAAMAALYVSVFSFTALLFSYIDYLFPSELERGFDPYSGIIRFSIASLIIIFPLFLFLMRMIHQDARKYADKRELGVRKWLVFLTIFLAGLGLIIDLVVLVNTFLNGELTMRFVLKVVVALVVAGSVFWYFLEEVRGKWEKRERMSVQISAGVGVLVLIAVIGGFFIIGSPQDARELRLDQARVNDLSQLQWQIVNYWDNKRELPSSLQALVDPISGLNRLPTDPKNGNEYGFRVTGDVSFELCAEFDQPSSERSQAYEYPTGGIQGTGSFEHAAGERCFERTIDPAFFSDTPNDPVRGLKPVPVAERL